MTPKKQKALKKLLEDTNQQFLDSGEILLDALEPALRYRKSIDKEFAAFVCALFAYGKVEQIKKSLHAFLDPMGENPVAFLCQNSSQDLKKLCKGWVHRFNTEQDLFHLLIILKSIYENEGSLEFFLKPQSHEQVEEILERFIVSIEGRGKKLKLKTSKSFWYLLPRPSKGSACKRLNLFLRWMVGCGPYDFSLWKSMSPRQLLIPLDTHVLKQSISLKLTKRKTADWKTVIEVTEKLKLLDPEDPTRYDFALCHLGMKGQVVKI